MIRIILAVLAACGLYWLWTLLVPDERPVDGSRYASGEVGSLTPPEQQYYVVIFNYVMDYIHPGQGHEWKTHNGSGRITVEAPFESKSKSYCRRYTETVTLGSVTGGMSGIACRRGGSDGWCRLKESDALTCALETAPITVEGSSVLYFNTNVPTVTVDAHGVPSLTYQPVVMPGAPHVEAKVPTAEEYADTVTGTAGNAAGPAASGAINWFKQTFH